MYMASREPDWERLSYSGVDCPHPALGSIGHSRHRRARRPALGPHQHAAWECCVILDGEVHWWAEQEQWHLRAGSVYLTAPGEEHGSVGAVMHPCRLRWCQIDAGFVGDRWRDLPARSWSDDGSVERLLEQLFQECHQPDPLSGDACSALLTHLLVAVQRTARAGRPDPEPPELLRLRQRIDRDPAWWPDIDDLAAHTGLGRTRLFQLARQHWQEAPLAHLGRLRLRRAGELLLADDRPVTAIAFDLGFASSQHFATAFKRASGFAPTAYRRQHMDA